MTPEQLATLTPEQKRIRIAEIAGYVGPFKTDWEWYEDGDSDGHELVLRDSKYNRVPDYLNDLNAMHEAEKVLNAEQQEHMGAKLAEATFTRRSKEMNYFNVAHATASQRADAFLLTL